MIYQHEIEIRVRYCETDAMGRLHHSRFLDYFEMGRTEMLRSLGQTYRQFEETGVFLVVTKVAVQYRGGARYDDALRLVTKTVRVTTARIDQEYELYRDHELLATAATTLGCVDRHGQIQRIPGWLRVEPPK